VHKLPQSVLDYIRKHHLLRPGDRVGVAVSGGADSVAMLRILLELRRELGIVISVVHFNHELRGAESDSDEQFVRELAAAHDLQFTCESADVSAYAAKKKLSLETAARTLRYGFLRSVLQSGDLDKIGTAHTLDDQAETVLLKLARGAGTRGLAGIYPRIGTQHSVVSSQQVKTIVRPLLETRRSDLEAYLAEIKQAWREDSSNRELRHMRNRVRREILPRLEQHVNPRVRETLGEAAEIARAEEEFWLEKIAHLLQQFWTRCDAGGCLDWRSRNWKSTEQLGLAVQRRVVRAAAESLGLNLEFGHVEEVLGLGEARTRATLPNGWSARWHKGQIHFERGSRTATNYEYHLPVPGKVSVPEAGIVIEAALVSGKSTDDGHQHEQLLPPRLAASLVIRNWRSGDRFWLANAKQPKKIKELLQDRSITGEEKKRWPVVASGDEVVWVAGMGVRRDLQPKGNQGVLILESPLE
jgi:tRNA(Ile)-lysidine synthase